MSAIMSTYGRLPVAFASGAGAELFDQKGEAFLEGDGFSVPSRARYPIGIALQRHEYEVARFWIKFWSDCRKVSLPQLAFWRDGSFRASVNVRGKDVSLVEITRWAPNKWYFYVRFI